MAVTTKRNEVVIVDDEMHNMTWLVDFLENRGFGVHKHENLNDALDFIDKEIYRFLIFDLNIPVYTPLKDSLAEKGAIYLKYPGLYGAFFARNIGYRDRQVILYSVHKDSEVARIARNMMCTYIMKGRPTEIKLEVESVISYDPTDN